MLAKCGLQNHIGLCGGISELADFIIILLPIEGEAVTHPTTM
jgi:hypothetical protein